MKEKKDLNNRKTRLLVFSLGRLSALMNLMAVPSMCPPYNFTSEECKKLADELWKDMPDE
jgi:hypothetical protein